MKIIFLGAPGAGKGTQADRLSVRLGIPTISTGAIIRAAIKDGTEMGLQAKEFIEKGEFVPDDVVINIVKNRLSKSDCDKGYILDGFPRSVPQAQALDDMGVHLDKVISLEVSDETIIERMSGRRVCPDCGKTYHVIHLRSTVGGKCESCGTKLAVRADDAPDVVRSRLEVYHSTTEPLKDFYREKGILCTVDGAESVEDTTKRTLEALGI
ncbi:MAG: adenylate kinase [Clostridia bacterium]|nr:adenylate kinase [Clostridia bacterium]